jgi:hypothetical protein
MTGNDALFAPPPSKTATKAISTGATARPPFMAAPQVSEKKKPVVLDMGEASREQGFRLYGCR